MYFYLHLYLAILSVFITVESRKRKVEEMEENEKMEVNIENVNEIGNMKGIEEGVGEEGEEEDDDKEEEEEEDEEKDEDEGHEHSLSLYPENMDLQNTDMQNTDLQNTDLQNTDLKMDNTVLASHLDARARKELKMHNKRAKSLDDGISVYCVPVNTVLKWR
jgi:uncharacterized protein YjbI with pentapeptide repeats